MELQTKKKKKHVINFITAFMLGCFFLACSGGGGGDDPEPKPQKPSISLNPSDLTFLSSKGDTKNLEIKTDANWSIVYCPNWLSASSSSGSGNMTISLTTTNDNNVLAANMAAINETNLVFFITTNKKEKKARY